MRLWTRSRTANAPGNSGRRSPMASSISSRPGEFELIREVFAPLSLGLPGAVGLTDDVALISPPPGCEVVLNTDAIVEGVHFRKSDPPESIAKKALRVNISDF